jgi:hypothetical protein
MVIEDHEKSLVDVMVFCKLGPATPKVHLAVSIVPHLYLIGSSSSRMFMKDCFTKFPPIRELRKFQWHPLNLTALSTGDAEEGINFGKRRGRSTMQQSAKTWCSSRNLGLVLTPHRAAGRRFTGMDDEATATGSFYLFLLPRGRPQPRFSTGAPMFRCEPPASAMEDKCFEKKPLDKMRKTKAMQRRKTVMKELGFFPSQRALFISKL